MVATDMLSRKIELQWYATLSMKFSDVATSYQVPGRSEPRLRIRGERPRGDIRFERQKFSAAANPCREIFVLGTQICGGRERGSRPYSYSRQIFFSVHRVTAVNASFVFALTIGMVCQHD